jgi:hypothetical protein
MANWTITATTIYCDSVEDEVTLIVNRDGQVQCTGYKRYYNPTRETARLMKTKSKQAGKQLACEGLGCYRVTQYRNKLMAEEGGETGRSAGGE